MVDDLVASLRKLAEIMLRLFTVRLLRNGGQAAWPTDLPSPKNSSSFTVDKINQQVTQLPIMSLVSSLFAISGCFPEGKEEEYSRSSPSVVVSMYCHGLNSLVEAEHHLQTLQQHLMANEAMKE